MGRTPAPETIRSADDVLDVLLAFIDGVIGDQPLLVAGHSAGGYYAAGDRPPKTGAGDRPGAAVPAARGNPRRAGARGGRTARAASATPTSATTSRCRPSRPWIDTSGTSAGCRAGRPGRARPDRRAVGAHPARSGAGSVSGPDAAGDRSPGLHGRLRPGLGDARAGSSRHLRGAGPGRSCAPARAARAGPRSGHRMARPGRSRHSAAT